MPPGGVQQVRRFDVVPGIVRVDAAAVIGGEVVVQPGYYPICGLANAAPGFHPSLLLWALLPRGKLAGMPRSGLSPS